MNAKRLYLTNKRAMVATERSPETTE